MVGVTQEQVTVLIADDDRLVAEALADLIAAQPGMRVVAVAHDACQAVETGCRLGPDLAIVDVNMPGGGGIAAVRGLRACAPRCRIVAISADPDREQVKAILTAGASGFVLKGGDGNQVLRALGAVLVRDR